MQKPQCDKKFCLIKHFQAVRFFNENLVNNKKCLYKIICITKLKIHILIFTCQYSCYL